MTQKVEEHPARVAWFRRKVYELGQRLAALAPDRRRRLLEQLEDLPVEDNATTLRHHDTTAEP